MPEPSTDDRDEMQAFARALFTDPDEPDEPHDEPREADPTRANVSPLEGTGPMSPASPHADVRAFARALFGRE
jgi:hypothetical protein